MLNNITIVKGDNSIIELSNILNVSDFKNCNQLYNEIKTDYIMFVEDISTLNLNRVNQICEKKLLKGDIIISLDFFDLLPSKPSVAEFKGKYLRQLIININGLIIKKSILDKISINISNLNRNIKEATEIVMLNPDIKILEEVIFNYKLKSHITIDSILDFKYLSKFNNYIYIYNMLEIVINNLSQWGYETSYKAFGIMQNELKNISVDDYISFLTLIVTEEEKCKLTLYINMIKNCNFEQVIYFSNELYEKNKVKDELKSIEFDVDKVQNVIKEDRLKAGIIWDKFITKIKDISVGIQYYLTKPFLEYKKIWLIGERTDQAEDNSYVFFKYMRENYPNKNIYYIIDKNSIQKENVEKLGNVIYLDSIKHKLYLMHAEKLISAYDFFNFLLPTDSVTFKRHYMKFMNSTRIFLQHGVALNKANYYNREINKYDFVLVSTVKEFNMFKYEYGFDESQIIRIGLPRYDNLVDTSNLNKNKKILIMPTWRNTLVDLTDNQFKETEYFKAINSIINNKELINTLQENEIEVVVYLHYEMQKFNHLFSSNSENISIKSREECIVQDLLKNCDLLITDYSSVGVDFSYLDKPVIFYQFSSHNFHYDINREEEYTLYSDFGQVTTREIDVINSLNRWINSGFENIYKIDQNLFYNRGTRTNCCKIYEFIEKIPKKNLGSYSIDIKRDNILKEKRLYDKNFEFIQREYYNNSGLMTSKLFYKKGYITKQEIYDLSGKTIKRVDFYKNIQLSVKYLDVYDDKGNIMIKHVVDTSGELKEKIIYFPGGQTIKTKRKYNTETSKISVVEEFYKNGVMMFTTLYNEDGKAIKYFYYNEDGSKRREYNYYESGKVKEKMFYMNGYSDFVKKQVISEINQSVIYEVYLNKRTNNYETKNYFLI